MGHRPGPVAIVSQSGALGYTVLQAMERGVGFSHYLAAGNSSDVEVADYIAYLSGQDEVRAIIALFQSVKDGPRFLQAAREAGKALIVILARCAGPALSESDSKAVLATYGVSVPGEALAASPDAAADAAERIGFPVVVKVASADILHKTEVDGVRVQRMIPKGVDLVVGVKRDSQFGPLVAFRLAPVSPAEALGMLASLRSYPLLTGFRGAPPADIDAVADSVCRVSELAADLADLVAEVDVNPVILSLAGAVAADALVVKG